MEQTASAQSGEIDRDVSQATGNKRSTRKKGSDVFSTCTVSSLSDAFSFRLH